MPLTMPSATESLTYSLIAGVAITIVTAFLVAATGNRDLLAALLVLAIAGGIYWFSIRNRVVIVSGKQATAGATILLIIGALAELAVGFPYHAVLFLLGAAALGFAVALFQQGATPGDLRLGQFVASAPSTAAAHLRMLEELRDAGVLTDDEFAVKRDLVVL